MEKLIRGLLPEAYELLRKTLSEGDEGKPHQIAARSAFRASAAADELGDEYKYGRIPPHEADKVRDAHKLAYDGHMTAAKKLHAAGQLGTARSHSDLAVKHSKAAAHYDSMYKAHGSGSAKKAANESLEWIKAPLLGAGRKSPSSAKAHLAQAGITLTEAESPWWTTRLTKKD